MSPLAKVERAVGELSAHVRRLEAERGDLMMALQAMAGTFSALADVGEPGPDRHSRTVALDLAERVLAKARAES